MGLHHLVKFVEESLVSEVSDRMLLLVAIISLVVAVVGLLLRIKDRVSLLLLVIGPLLGLLAWATLGWESLSALGVLCAATLGIGVFAYWILRLRALNFSVATALAAGGAAPALTLWLLAGAGLTDEGSVWPALILPAGLLVCVLLAAALAAGRKAVAAEATGRGKSGPRAGTETRLVLEMLQQEKISAAEAADLFEAVRPGVPADRLPISGGVVASLLGGLEIVIGWMMPWAYRAFSDKLVYMSGFHFEPHGWLLLVLGVLPVMLACVPALDQYLRQGMLRLFLALIGLALTVSLMTITAQEGGPGVGLVLCLIGFGTQLIGALKESGLVRRPARREEGGDD